MSASGARVNESNRNFRFSEIDQPTEVLCTVVAIDHRNLCYRVCDVCERTLPENSAIGCRFCNYNIIYNPNPSGSKRLFRVLMSIATETKVSVVIMFDRVARVLFGCSADEFFHFTTTHPFAAETACKALNGEIFAVKLSKPKGGYAQHDRVVSVVPMQTGFTPVIETLREVYRVGGFHDNVII